MKKSFKFVALMAIVLLVAFSILMVGSETKAAGAITNITATLSDYTADATSTLTLTFELETTFTDGDDIRVTFESDFDSTSVTTGSVTLTSVGGNPTLGTVAATGSTVTVPTTAANSASGLFTLTIPGLDNGSAGSKVISIATNDVAGDGTTIDEGAAEVVVGLNQVNINGTVDPVLTLSLSANNCDLGTIATTEIASCSYTTTVTTNAASGYTGYIKDDGALSSGSNTIPAIADSQIEYDDTVAEYGIATNDVDPGSNIAIADSVTCPADGGTTATNASAITTSDLSYAYNSGAIDSDVVTVCHMASIIGTTPAGAYSNTVTITVVGNF